MNGRERREPSQPAREWFPLWGVVGVVSAFAVVVGYGALGLPLDTESQQLGYRGTGMVEIGEAEDRAALLATLDAIPESEAPYEAEDGAPLAGEVYENVEVLGHLTEDNFLRVMNAITLWVSPEQGCAYCHGEEGNFADEAFYTYQVSRRMIQMTQEINSEWDEHVQQVGVTCYTCHRGRNVPEHIWWLDPQEDDGGLLGRSLPQNMPSPRVAGSSLPNDVFAAYFLGDRDARVIPQQPNHDDAGGNIMDTEWTFGLMMHMSTSLGVNCTYCHNTRSMSQWDQSPPSRAIAWHGVEMVRSLNVDYMAPLQPVYPPMRLGPTGDAPKANCATCHQGVYQPLYGAPMLQDYPELAEPGPGAENEQAALR